MITFDRDICFVDIETLGLERTAPVWEFAAIRLGADGTEDRCELQVIHQEGRWLESLPEQFVDSYRARFDVQNALPPAQVARAVDAITAGAIIAGSNPSFDMGRLEQLMDRFGITPSWHYHPLDIPSMAAGYMGLGRLAAQAISAIPSELSRPLAWKSDDLSLGINVNPSDYARHTAMGDVEWCLAQWHSMTAGAQ